MDVHMAILEVVLEYFKAILWAENSIDRLVLDFTHAHNFPLVDESLS